METLGEASRCVCDSDKAAFCQSAFVLAAHQTLARGNGAKTNSLVMTEMVLNTNLEIAGCRLTKDEVATRLGDVVVAMVESKKIVADSSAD